MKLLLVGTAGSIPTPKLFCECEICQKARTNQEYKRHHSSLFIKEINTLIDCGEDISDAINQTNIKQINNLFITHWHPDHTFGLRLIMENNFDFINEKVKKITNIYVPKKIYEQLKEHYPAINYYIEVLKVGKIIFINEEKIDFENISITPIPYNKNKDIYGYLIKENKKQILYTPCDTMNLENWEKFKNLDYWITECGMFSDYPHELTFSKLKKRIQEINPKQTIITHIEEDEVRYFGYYKMKKLENEKLKFGFDGMEIDLQ